MDDRTLFFFIACCKWGRHIYTTTAPSCCFCIVLPPAGHSSNHGYHFYQLTKQSSCVSNFYRNFMFSFDSPSCYRAPDTVAVTKSSQMSGTCSTYGDIGDVHIVWARKFEGNGLLGRYKRIWEDIIKSYLNKYDTMVWNAFIWSRRRETWQDNVKAVMNFWVPWKAGNYLIIWGNVSFSWRILFHGISCGLFLRLFYDTTNCRHEALDVAVSHTF